MVSHFRLLPVALREKVQIEIIFLWLILPTLVPNHFDCSDNDVDSRSLRATNLRNSFLVRLAPFILENVKIR